MSVFASTAPVCASPPVTAPPRRRGRPRKVVPLPSSAALSTDASITFIPRATPTVESLLPLAGKIASWFERRYSLPAGWEHDDLLHEGVVGLMRAAAKYDPTQSCSLETYAGYWIRGFLWRALKARWTDLNHEAPPPEGELEGPWLPPERAVLCREVIGFVDRLDIAEQTLFYGRIDDETISSLARQLGLSLSAAFRRHEKALRKIRQAAGVKNANVHIQAA